MTTPSIESLYAKHPALREAETTGEHRLESRRPILRLLGPGTTGAELGVFTGLFSEVIVADVEPTVLHLVDPWALVYGERYPDWGAYTDGGRLTTAAAQEAAEARAQAAQPACEAQVHVTTSIAWLESIDDRALDWAYVDSTHEYEDTREELDLLATKIRPNGLVLGDDWQPDPDHPHHGVFRAVHDVVRSGLFDLVRVDEHMQWALRPAVRYSLAGRVRRAARTRLRR